MSAVALRDLHNALDRLPVESLPSSGVPAKDAQLGLREIEALRQVDLVTPPEIAQVAEPLVDLYRGKIENGDALRLEQPARLDGASMRAAVARVLAVDPQSIRGTPAQLDKLGQMLRVLDALDSAVAGIQRQAAMARR